MSMEKMVETTDVVDVQVQVEQEEAARPGAGSAEVKVRTAEEEPSARPRTLYRHPTDKMVGGVCGGLADFLGWDSTFVRLFWIVATLVTGGGGFLAYFALWILLPVGTAAQGQLRPAGLALSERNLMRAAYLLIGAGVLWLLANIGVLGSLWGALWSLVNLFFWPALLIGVGYLLLRNNRRDWRQDFAGVRGRFKSGVNGVRSNVDGKMPSRGEVKSGMREVKQRIPLKRSRSDRMLLGVCGGVGQRLGIDSNLVRLIWAAFSIGSIGMGVLLYVLIGLLLPEESAIDLARAAAEPQDVEIVDGTAGNVA